MASKALLLIGEQSSLMSGGSAELRSSKIPYVKSVRRGFAECNCQEGVLQGC